MEEEAKFVQFKLRMPEWLKYRLDGAAADAGRSVSAEIIHRLQKSFQTFDEMLISNRYAEIRELESRINELDARAVLLSRQLNLMSASQESPERQALVARLHQIDQQVRKYQDHRKHLDAEIKAIRGE